MTTDTCRHGHIGWMFQRYMWDAKRQKSYWCWVCRECARIRNNDCSQRRRDRQKAAA